MENAKRDKTVTKGNPNPDTVAVGWNTTERLNRLVCLRAQKTAISKGNEYKNYGTETLPNGGELLELWVGGAGDCYH